MLEYIDKNYFETLKSLGSRKVGVGSKSNKLRELVELFISQSDECFMKIPEEDVGYSRISSLSPDVLKVIHKIKGSAGAMGAKKLYEHCCSIENTMKKITPSFSGSTGAASDNVHFADLRNIYRNTKVELMRYARQ